MKLVKGLKTTSRKKTVTQGIAESKPATQTASPAARSATKSNTGNGASKSAVTIEAKIDVGFGNQLYLRGEGEGLSWSQGIPLTCVDGSTWKWTGSASDKLKFKLLLNDAVWAKGEDIVVTPGQQVQLSPAF